MNRRLLIVFGIVLVLLAALWRFGLSPRLLQRIPADWLWQANFIGISTYPDSATGQFPEQDTTGTYERSIRSVPDASGAPGVLLEDSYIIRDAASQEITYEYLYQARVDPATGAHTDQNYLGDYFVFPRNVERQTYKLRFSYITGLPIAFADEEEIEGLTTYLFAYKGRAEYTESYIGNVSYPGTVIKAGQEIKCADDQFILKIWVEPVTGETIKVDESCYSGDYVYDIASGQQRAAILRWGGVTTGDDVIRRVDQVRDQRFRALWIGQYLPGLGFLIGMAMIVSGGVSFWRRRA